MAKPIKLNEMVRASIVDDFIKKLESARLTATGFKYEKSFSYEDKRHATIVYSKAAWYKTVMIVDTQPKEVGWHGICRRDSEDPSTFHIEDIILYPQKVTGTTITPDEVEYTEWMNGLDDDTFNNLRFHGHSHVNMGVFSSGTDEKFRNDRMSQLQDDDFYVFQVFNKRGEIHSAIYDYLNNTLYENDDIETLVECETMDIWDDYVRIGKMLRGIDYDKLAEVAALYDAVGMGEFLDDAAQSVKEEKFTYQYPQYQGGYYNGGYGQNYGGKKDSTTPNTSGFSSSRPAPASKETVEADDDDEGFADQKLQDIIKDPFGVYDGFGEYDYE